MIFLELFATFFLIGISTFGGGYAMIPLIKDLVLSKGWISESALTDFIAISESTPGPFAINISTFVGKEIAGIFGAICSTLGVVLPSLLIIVIIAALINKFNKKNKVLKYVKPLVVGLILYVAISFFIKYVVTDKTNINYFNNLKIGFFLDLLLIIRLLKKKKSVSPILIIVISALLGIVIL